MSAFNAFSSDLSPSWISMARRVLPSRLELKSFEGSSNEAPLAKVIFTTLLYVSPVQRMPPCSHTGTPRHFHSSTTSGSACLMSARTRASISPRQSSSSLMRASISRAGDSALFACLAPLAFFGAAVLAFFMTCLSHAFARQRAGLLHPLDELAFVELVFADIEITHFFVLGLTGGNRPQRGAAEEGHLDVVGEAMEAEKPNAVLHAIERRVPFD